MLSRSGLGIRSKLIGIFVLIKVIPLVLLAWFAWQGQVWLAERVSGSVVGMVQQMRETAEAVANTTTNAAITALDAAARESMERMTTDVARSVATFLYDRDRDIASAALLAPEAGGYRRFLAARTRAVERPHPWVMAPDGSGWVPGPEATPRYDVPPAQPSLPEQARNFNYRHPDTVGVLTDLPLFMEMTFVGLDGKEQVKVVTSDQLSPLLRDVSRRENTYLKAETYFPALQALKPGEIYVSDVIGAYVQSPVIGPYTPAAAQKRGIAFAPEQAGYAGVENPVGKRFQGIIRWATPVQHDGKIVGWVTLALDHNHLMEFTDHILPAGDRYSPIPDATSGNYAFIWDYKGRSIVHPRHYFITGYDPETGEPAPPWMDQALYDGWKASGKPVADYLAGVPPFDNQSWDKKGAAEQVKDGTLGLDCRYLNHAPQCIGWMDLTQNGGSGSFDIFWSGLWKLTTAAAIPYRTGQYGQSPRGFGFVTIGANVDDFHRAATESKQAADRIVAEHDRDLQTQLDAVLALVGAQVRTMAQQLTASTVMMGAVVVVIAIWMASFLTRRITTVVQGIRRFEDGDMAYRLPVQSTDEMGVLASSFNDMADRVGESFQRAEEARLRAEEASRMKSEFLASMSHELRTPLNGIIGFAELLKDDAEDEDARENAEVIEKSGRHLLNLVNTILDVAKIEAGAMSLVREAVDMRALVAEVAAIHQSGAVAKGLDFQVSLADDLPPTLWIDPVRVRQVLHNLLSNAVKFTPSGHVHTAVLLADHAVALRVSDSGPGIAEDLQSKIFEKFHQGDAFLTRSHGGTGLGLTLARHLVELMGGKMELDSVVGRGSVFIFTLPVDRS
ncbi:sensor histidine kinase [Magnetospirillum sulfuroxidans]|uniref:histidine kinase n=1 Tax=Magnetospirillum sulfuroxidans TaxID=611300 RepID=A0ABS5IHY4_9PROT|nr:HAMP domain-containing sensor histidine kinase [Magnetospirillum sulfuroxidans]MBR9973373.1 HAMP domain-containing histidine kinase [Magnetospirillum sulfuroxidans]